MPYISDHSYNSLEDGISSAVNALGLGLTTVWSNSNGVEPQTDYIEMMIISDDKISQGQEDLFVTDEDGEQTIKSVYKVIVRFQFVGKKPLAGGSTSAANVAKQFESKFKFSNTRYKFAEYGISVLSVGSLRQIPVERDTAVYTVTGIDITFAYEQIDVMEIDYIENIEGEGTLKEGLNGDLSLSLDIDSP